MSIRLVLPNPSDVVKFRNQDIEKIRNHCAENKITWDDPLFSPDIGECRWKRPCEMVDSPRLLEETASHDVRSGMLNDGYVAVAMQALTCRPQLLHWVVPPDQKCTEDNRGVVHFRIWQLGTWYDVCVDDKVPTMMGEVAYTHSSNKHEFWCTLLEKAYAKLRGSYKTLEGGQMAEAMVDFSGGISEVLSMENLILGLGGILFNAHKKHLFVGCSNVKEHRNSRGSIGIIEDDQYCITGVKQIPSRGSNKTLVRLRNPSKPSVSRSSCELRKSIIDMGEVDVVVENAEENDREFWINDLDLMNHFTTVTICHFTPNTFMTIDEKYESSSLWWLHTFKGEWVIGISAGGKGIDTIHQNHQYRITFPGPDDGDRDDLCSIVVSLMQKNKTRQLEWNLGFKIFKLENHTSLPSPLGHDFFMNNPHNFGYRLHCDMREAVSLQKLLPGVYCIIPCTRNQNEEGEFLLRVFTKQDVPMVETDRRISIGMAHDVASELVLNREIPVVEESTTDEETVKFFYSVADEDKSVDWRGLKVILDAQMTEIFGHSPFVKVFNTVCENIAALAHYLFPSDVKTEPATPTKIVFSKELCRNLIAMMDTEYTGKIGFDEFDHLWTLLCQWKLIFRLSCKDRKNAILKASNFNEALEKAGFILSKEVLGRLIHRYADEEGHLTFDDFAMCLSTLEVDLKHFNDADEDQTGRVVISFDEWVRKSTTF